MSRQVNPEFPGHFNEDPPNQFIGSISASESISTNCHSRRKERQAVFGSSVCASEYQIDVQSNRRTIKSTYNQIDVQSTPRIGTLNTVAPLPPRDKVPETPSRLGKLPGGHIWAYKAK
ncbi:hypothetical protein PM082_015065 [Marasmius tenuissimus]|nr:hypothetical protein PM082_015065 [Marasmius tenuissimus]